jgi:hypoxanthine phosphoribosyltransferase
MQSQAEDVKVVVSAEQIQQRLKELARHISADYRNRTVAAVGVLEDGFIFMADLVRQLDVPVTCQFIKPEHQELWRGNSQTEEIFFSPEVEVKGADVLLVQGLIETAVTTEFLVRNLLARGAKSVKVATLLDRGSARRVGLQPDYYGFQIEEGYVFGYGLGAPQLKRNLPYVATQAGVAVSASPGT